MPPPPERAGTPLRISGQRINFSPWPTKKGGRGYVLQPEVLSNAPWDVIEYAVKGKYGSRSSNRKVCLSFLEQAKAFYFASETYDEAARPLLLYYSFLNLAKCFIQYTGTEPDLDNAQHGLWERRGKRAFFGSTVHAARTSAKNKNVFDLLGQALGLNALSTNKSYKVIKHVIPQIVIGHRLWSSASGKAQKFVRCDRISFRHHKGQRQIWIKILVRRDDIRSCNLTHVKFAKLTGLSANYRIVSPRDERFANDYVVFEQINPISYTRRPSDTLHTAVATLVNHVTPIIRSVPPIDVSTSA